SLGARPDWSAARRSSAYWDDLASSDYHGKAPEFNWARPDLRCYSVHSVYSVAFGSVVPSLFPWPSEAPAESLQRHSASGIHLHAFTVETNPLRQPGGSARSLETEAALCIDDSMPRQRGAAVERTQRVADESRLSRQSRHARDRAIRRYLAARHLAHRSIDP